MASNNTTNYQTANSPAILLMPLLALIAVATLSLTFNGDSFSLAKFQDIQLLSIHGALVSVLFVGYYLIIKNIRAKIEELALNNIDALEQLEKQTKLLRLETYQHQKTNTELYQLKTKDPLTQVFNQTHFQELLNNEIDRCRRYESQFSLLIIELDNFMKINEEYGHDFGDFIMTTTTKLIERQLRKSDLLARYDRHNLAIIAPNTNLEASKVFADRLCQSIETAYIVHEAVHLQMTLSIGVGSSMQFEKITTDNLAMATDNALRIAINVGRNQAVVVDND